MKDRNIQSGELDKIGRSLLKMGVVPADEIERIVSRPELFSSIISRIESENAETQPTGFLPAWRMRLVFSGGLAVAAITAVLVTFAVFGGSDVQPDIAYVVEPPDEVVVETSPQSLPAAEPAPSAPNETKPRTLDRQPVSVTAKVFRRKETKRAAEPKKQEKAVDLGEFYALAHVPNAPDAALDAQVIRVEMPRASLVALGINLPLDNGRENVKTDLLVGSDGVPRAIRLVE